MSDVTKCWRCQTEAGQFWATIRVAGMLDEYDVALCGSCLLALGAAAKTR